MLMMPAIPAWNAVQPREELIAAVVADPHHLTIGISECRDLIGRKVVHTKSHPELTRHRCQRITRCGVYPGHNRRIRRYTDTPVCVGVGVSTPEQAAEVCEVADGVVVGSALVRRLLTGGGPEAAADFVGSLRTAID